MNSELEYFAGDLDPSQRRELATLLEHWAQQIRASAIAIERDEEQRPDRASKETSLFFLRRN